MNQKKYPDKRSIRHQSKQACKALTELARLGVEVVRVTFRTPHPLIEVEHCPGTDKIKNCLKGQGEDENGKYIRKVALIRGCQVEWCEVRL